MRGKEEATTSKSIAYIIFSLKPKTVLTGKEWKGYASRTNRLDILVRTTYLLLTSKIITRFRETDVSLVLYGPPNPPLHIHLTPIFYQSVIRNERELMKQFIQIIYGEQRRGKGYYIETRGLLEVVNHYIMRGYSPVLLAEKGENKCRVGKKTVFLLGSDADIPLRYIDWIDKVIACNMGPQKYLSSHVAYISLLATAFMDQKICLKKLFKCNESI